MTQELDIFSLKSKNKVASLKIVMTINADEKDADDEDIIPITIYRKVWDDITYFDNEELGFYINKLFALLLLVALCSSIYWFHSFRSKLDALLIRTITFQTNLDTVSNTLLDTLKKDGTFLKDARRLFKEVKMLATSMST